MNERVKRLTEEFAKLTPDEQAELIDRLIVLRKPDPEIDKAWVEEAERRIDALDRGETRAIPHDEAMARLQKRFGLAE
jgi:putative addiction module component (TIGR02574 family)